MERLLMLTSAWILMRRYIFRRRTRIERETLVTRMTQKLRELAKLKVRRPAKVDEQRSFPAHARIRPHRTAHLANIRASHPTS